MARKQRTVAAVLEADTGRYRTAMRNAGTHVTQFARKVEGAGRRIRQAMRNTGIGNVSQSMKGLAASAAAMAGIAGIGGVLKSVMEFDDALTELMITGDQTNIWMETQRRKMIALSSKWGVARGEVANFALKFVELTGDAKGAMVMLEDMTKRSVAYKVSMTDLGKLMENLSGSFQITAQNAGLALDVIREISKKGTIGFGAMAKIMPEVASSASNIGDELTKINKLKVVGALLQATYWKKGTVEGSKTSTARFFDNLKTNAGKIEEVLGGGFKELTLMKKLRMLGAAARDPGKALKLEKLFGLEGKRTFYALGDAYGPGSRGKAFQQMIGATGKGQLEGDLSKRMGSAGQRWRVTMNQITNQLVDKFLPVLQKLVQVMPSLAKLFGFFIENIETLIAVGLQLKAARFFSNLAMAGRAAGALGAAGMAGRGGAAMNAAQVGAMYGTRGAAGVGVGAAARPSAGARVAGAVSKAFLVTALMDMILPGLDKEQENYLDSSWAPQADELTKIMAARKVGLHGILGAAELAAVSTGMFQAGAVGTGAGLKGKEYGAINVRRFHLTDKLSSAVSLMKEKQLEIGRAKEAGVSAPEIEKKFGPEMNRLNTVIQGLQSAINNLKGGIMVRATLSTPSQTVKANANPPAKAGG